MNGRVIKIKQVATILLAVVGIGAMVFYAVCDTECSYLKGDIFGVDLKYIGIAFMAVIALLAGTGKYPLLRAALAAGLGGEAFLVWFQIKESVYCPFCLAFAGCLIAAFAVNYEYPSESGWKKILYIFGGTRLSPNTKRYPLILFMLAGFGFFLLTFSGSTLPAYAADFSPVSYGQGKNEIRIYTDYFCPPCRRAEPRIEKLINAIVKNDKGRILFVDMPIHPPASVLYARYYLYAVGAGGETLRSANHIRRVLFVAAEKGIKTESELKDFLEASAIKVARRDVAPYFRKYEEYIKEDKVSATPTIVVVTPEGKSKYSGEEDILRVLDEIRR